MYLSDECTVAGRSERAEVEGSDSKVITLKRTEYCTVQYAIGWLHVQHIEYLGALQIAGYRCNMPVLQGQLPLTQINSLCFCPSIVEQH